jgi:hypothetical protein
MAFGNEDYMDRLEAENKKLKTKNRKLLEAAKAYRDLCTCYRIGKRTTEKLFDRIYEARGILDKED